jgi:hypothetical protein
LIHGGRRAAGRGVVRCGLCLRISVADLTLAGIPGSACRGRRTARIGRRQRRGILIRGLVCRLIGWHHRGNGRGER